MGLISFDTVPHFTMDMEATPLMMKSTTMIYSSLKWMSDDTLHCGPSNCYQEIEPPKLGFEFYHHWENGRPPYLELIMDVDAHNVLSEKLETG